MSKLPKLPPPTLENAIKSNSRMRAQCRICKTDVTWETEDLKQLVRVKPSRGKLLAVELFNLRRCPKCDTHTLIHGHMASPGPRGLLHERAAATRPKSEDE